MSGKKGWVFPAVMVSGMVCVGLLGTFGLKTLTTGRLSDVDDPKRFDFSKHYALANALIGPGWRYVSTVARGVKPDGSMDLTAPYEPTVTYQWRAALAAPADEVPIGASVDVKVPVALVEVNAPGWHVATQRQGKTSYRWSRGIERRELDYPASSIGAGGGQPPTCALKALWDEALRAGAPKNAVATIRHDAQGYTFDIDGTDHRYAFNHACERTK